MNKISTLLSCTALSLGSYGQNRPNIIFIMSDDHAANAISCYNQSLINTPNIDKLAKNGVRFTNCFCTNSVSGPSRASIITGQLSHINGFFNNEFIDDTMNLTKPAGMFNRVSSFYNSESVFDSSNVTFPKILHQNGYQTAFVGKWHLVSDPRGFDDWKMLIGQGKYYNPDFIENGIKVREPGYVTDIIMQQAIQWLEKRDRDKPFFLEICNKAPHRNWMPRLDEINIYDSIQFLLPENFYDNYEDRQAAQEQKMSVVDDLVIPDDLKITGNDSYSHRNMCLGCERMTQAQLAKWDSSYAKINSDLRKRKLKGKELGEWKYQRYMHDYLATIHCIDENIGKLLDYLKKNNLLENTIIMYTSDQGFYLGEHGWFDKRFMYEESLRMPLLIEYPSKLKNGAVCDKMIMNVDFAPTILDWAGIKAPQGMQGESFAKVINNEKEPWRDEVYYHYFEFPGWHSVKRHYGIRTERYKLIHFYFDIDTWELYDLNNDPHEMHNLIDDRDYSDIKIDLEKRLTGLRKKYKDTISTIPVSSKLLNNKAKSIHYTLSVKPDKNYNGVCRYPLIDGVIENYTVFSSTISKSWIGFKKDDVEINFRLDSVKDVSSVELRFLDYPDYNIDISHPAKVEVLLSNDGFKFIDAKIKNTIEKRPHCGDIYHYTAKFGSQPKFIKIKIKNKGTGLPDYDSQFQPAWLFTDEVIFK